MQNFQTPLDDQDLLEVGGKDSEKFLQGQLTCDLTRLADLQIALGALCNNKGRVYANFRILKKDAGFLLIMPKGIGETAQKQLAKYIPFYQAQLNDASARFQRTGLAGADAEDWLSSQVDTLPAPGQAISIGTHLIINLGGATPRYEYWVPADEDSPVAASGLPVADAVAWHWLDMTAGLFFIQPEAIEAFTPEELNLDLAGFVSFDKGCYTGQEIVARMHYRGKAGKRAYLVSAQHPEPFAAEALTDSLEKTLGKVYNILFLNNNILSYSVLKTAQPSPEIFLIDTAGHRLPGNLSLPAYSA